MGEQEACLCSPQIQRGRGSTLRRMHTPAWISSHSTASHRRRTIQWPLNEGEVGWREWPVDRWTDRWLATVIDKRWIKDKT